MQKPTLVSGIQPTGRLHLGNYLGALKNFVNLQDSGKYQCLFFIADYHSLTGRAQNLKEKVLDLQASYLAAGLNPKKSILFNQSDVSAHTELAWILSTVTPFGDLGRITQFKDKSKNQADNINVGLFTYPVLMAADILLYDATFVPVGDDQIQHLELVRTLARKFNNKFSKTFIEPRPLLTDTPRIKSFSNPTKKMSKSDPRGCLFLDDSKEEITKKVMSAVTDSGSEVKYDEKSKPALSNLIRTYNILSGQSLKEIEKKFSKKGYGEFKKSLADTINKYFAGYRKKKNILLKSQKKVTEAFQICAKKANVIASKKLESVKKKLF